MSTTGLMKAPKGAKAAYRSPAVDLLYSMEAHSLRERLAALLHRAADAGPNDVDLNGVVSEIQRDMSVRTRGWIADLEAALGRRT